MANEKFKINGVVSEVVPIVGDTGDVLKKTVSGVEWGSLDKATQAEAEAGTNDTKIMTPLKVKQVTEQFATKTELANIDLTEELENLATKTELADKVDKISGKQLSTNDYTTTEKNKLAGIETGAQKNNVTNTDIANWNNKVDKVSGKQLSTNDYTTTEKNKLAGIQAGAQVNAVTSVNGQTGAVTTPDTTYNVATTSSNGLMSSADKTKLNGVETGAQKNIMTSADKTKLDGIEAGAQKNNVTSTDIANWNNKVDKVSGKQLSTNDYTDTEKNKLSGIEAGAQKNIMTSADKVKLDKFTEVENKPYYNGEEIGGVVPNLTLNELTLGSRFKIVYNDIEDSLDIEVI